MRYSILLVGLFTILSSFTKAPVQKFPNLSLKTIEGQNFSLDKTIAKNKLTVIDFWATWCGPCKKELDAIKSYYEGWQKEGIELVAITIDDSQQLNKVKPMVQQKGWKYTVISDINKQSLARLGFQSIPQTYIVNQKGEIVYSHPGYTPGDEKELNEKLHELLKS